MKRHFLSLLLLSSTSLFSMQPDFASRLSALRKRSYGETQAQPSVSAHEHGSSSQPRQLITCTRRQYTVPDFDEQTIAIIMEEFKVTKPIAQTLFHRGLKDRSSIAEFLNPSYDHAARHPSLLKDANKAVERIARALEPLLDENGEIMLDENGKIMREKILIVGDYDVDGMTSTALLINCLEPLGANIDYQCPHRINDGYGVRPKHIEKAKKDGCSIVITVDNGISAFEAGQKAKELGIDLIITDHHQEHDELPYAYAIVNPNQKLCTYPCKALAGVGVSFKLMQLLYEQRKLELPKKAHELMMLGTIADVVPLVDENRYWVRKGMQITESWRSPSLQTLIDNAQIERPTISSTDISYGIAPQLNAIGRLDDANVGVDFLLDRGDAQTRQSTGVSIKGFNDIRKKMQEDMSKELSDMVYKEKSLSIQYDPIFIASSPNWHPGINGLVAAKAVEKWHKPTILLTEMLAADGTVILKGSGRSIAKYNLFKGLQACKDLFRNYGGHPVAAGLSLEKSKLNEFKERLKQHFIQTVEQKDRANKAEIDGIANFDDLAPQIVKDLSALEPFGNSNPSPCLYFGKVISRSKPTWLGGGHVRADLEQEGTEKEKTNVNFFFRADAYYALPEMQGRPFDLVGTVNDNWWQGNHDININAIDFEKRQTYGQQAQRD